MNPSNPEESNIVVVAPTTLTGFAPEYPRLLASPSSFGPVLFPLPTPRNSFGPVLVQPPFTPNSCGPVLFPRPTPLNPFGPVLVRSPSTPNRDFRPEIHPDERCMNRTWRMCMCTSLAEEESLRFSGKGRLKVENPPMGSNSPHDGGSYHGGGGEGEAILLH
ncbi:unnamed protein product [Arabis nemorensis]|uniref:Uncharacterized protein n=1 Tax=Arabis nemorensis TaxID=586526 RepID=A0A565BPT8_9BRAS|nr:unnamed protein product [Arabis nemorensis]